MILQLDHNAANWRNRTGLAFLFLALCLPVGSSEASTSVLARWSFDDPSPSTNANYSASTVSVGVVVSDITCGSGVMRHNAFNDTDRTTASSYIDHSSLGYGDPPPGGPGWFVPTASVGGGESGGAFLDFMMMPQHVNDLAESIASNRYFQISITAQKADLTLTEIRFYAQQSTYDPARCIDKGQWRVDSGSGYTNWGGEMVFATTRYELESVTGFQLVVTNGTTVYLRFHGFEANNDPYGRTLAMDDLTILGVVKQAPRGTLLMVR